MKKLFTPEEMAEINKMLAKRIRQRLGGDPDELKSQMLTQRDGLTVSEGMCPHCRKAMERLPKHGNTIRWQCSPCSSIYRIVDPHDEINRLTGGK